ncbi:MAG TPA: hypothetical protein VGA36_07185 [Nitriliruptorales bacterium]
MSAAIPWWASDEAVAGLDEHQDPFRAHRSARSADVAEEPDWVRLLGELAVNVVRRLSTVAEDRTDEHHHGPNVDDEACRNCPVCMLMRASDRSGPEVAEHLADAARSLALAAASFLEAFAERPNDGERPSERSGPERSS